jgi:type IV pilus assembly protein PilE
MRLKNIRRATEGMTLIELLVVIAVVAILTSIATGAYRRYMLRANRTDGTMLLLKLQAAEEKFYLQNNTYTANLGSDGLGLDTAAGTTSLTSAGGFYKITVAAGTTGTLATSYAATATAIAGQTKDTSCPTFTINDQGVHGPGTASAAALCWK